MFGIYTRIRRKLHPLAVRITSPIYKEITLLLRPILKKHIAIMLPVPSKNGQEEWGDYHFAVAMKKAFEQKGFHVTLRYCSEWNLPYFGRTVIALRGLQSYTPKSEHLNIMWNISHPDMVSEEEYNQYDKVYIASEFWAKKLSKTLSTDVESLLQCSDTDVFNPNTNPPKRTDLLFVGNTRGVFRDVVKYALSTGYDLSVYGNHWEHHIDSKHIKGIYIPNETLSETYRSCCILLNDHWEDMRNKGFISNRLFDGLACGAFIISDDVLGLEDTLPNCIVTYKDQNDFQHKVEYYMSHPEERNAYILRGQALVKEKHTFHNRIDTMINYINNNSSEKKRH